MNRFTGTVEELCQVDVSAMSTWIRAIPFDDWPQQTRLADGKIRPAMVNEPKWHGFMNQAAPVVEALAPSLLRQVFDRRVCEPGEHKMKLSMGNMMLSVVMPGASIEPHRDRQPADWLFRVHVPLQADDGSRFIVEGENHLMRVGYAYLVNTEREHAVRNEGPLPRVHFMFDVRAQSAA